MKLASTNHLKIGWLRKFNIKDVSNLADEKCQAPVVRNLRVSHAQHRVAHRCQGVLALVILRDLLGILNRMIVVTVVFYRKAHLGSCKVDLHAALACNVASLRANSNWMVEGWTGQPKAVKVDVE